MEDEVDGLVDVEMLGHVVIDEAEALAAQMLHVLERSGLEVVDADDAQTLSDEVVAEVRAEEACASGDHSSRHLQSMLARYPASRVGLYE